MKNEILDWSLIVSGTVVCVALFGEDLFICVHEFVDFWAMVFKEWHE